MSNKPTFNVLVATSGRPSLINMLNSVLPQLSKDDYLTLIFDGGFAYSKFIEYYNLSLKKEKYRCNVSINITSENLGYWGHGIRNKYQNTLLGDFILNADDDDEYAPNAFEIIRKHCTDKNQLYLFKEKYKNSGATVWQDNWLGEGREMQVGAISTACGVIPNTHNLPDWEYIYGGDGLFYKKLTETLYPNFKLVDEVIYLRND